MYSLLKTSNGLPNIRELLFGIDKSYSKHVAIIQKHNIYSNQGDVIKHPPTPLASSVWEHWTAGYEVKGKQSSKT